MSQEPGTCPEGHALPHAAPNGRQCRVTLCNDPADEGASAYVPPPVTDLALVPASGTDEHAESRLACRHKMVGGVPQNLEGQAAEEYADKKLVKLLPLAAAELEWQLKYGSDSMRRHAMKDVLEATGRSRREALAGGTAPIIILTGGQVTVPPWSTNRAQQPQVVEGEVVNVAPAEATSADKQDT